jgi:hypothetical protein
MSGTEEKKWDRSDIIRYSKGEMSERERNTFEKELQRDPFLADAADGYDLISGEEADEDLKVLKRQLTTTRHRKSYLVYSGVAAALLLLIVSSVWLFYFAKESSVKSIVASDSVGLTPDTNAIIALTPQPLIVPQSEVATQEAKSKVNTEAETTDEKAEIRSAITKSAAVIKPDTAARVAMPQTAGALNEVVVTDVSAVPDREMLSRLAAGARQEAARNPDLVRGFIYSTEDSLPIPGAIITVKGSELIGTVAGIDGSFSIPVRPDSNMILVANFIGMEPTEIRAGNAEFQRIGMRPSSQALDEVIITGYGAASRKTVIGARSEVKIREAGDESVYSSARPEGGNTSFNDYIKANIKYPDAFEGGAREVVVIDMALSETGQKGNCVAVRSPGEPFTLEAVRLLMEGPEWKPSTVNGKAIADTIRIRIVFRR